jgi:hypothetical protein
MHVKRLALGVVIGTIAIAVGLALLPDRVVFWSPDEGGKYLDLLQMDSPVRLRHPLPYPGRALDPELEHVPILYYYQDGSELTSWWPSWFPALSAPFYRHFGFAGLTLIPVLSGILIGFAVYHTVSAGAKAVAYAACLTLVGSPIVFYSFTFWEHTLHTLLVLLGCLAAIRSRTRSSLRGYGISGALLGLALYLRLETVFFLAGLGLTEALTLYQRRGGHIPWRRHLRRWGLFALCLAVTLLPYGVLYAVNDGNLGGRFHNPDYEPRRIGPYPPAVHSGSAEVLPNLLLGTRRHEGADLPPTLRWLFAVATVGSALWPWLHGKRSEPIAIASVLTLVTLCSRILFSDETYAALHGWVVSAPWIVLAGWACHPAADAATRRWGYLGLFSSLAFLGASVLQGWEGQGGLQWGPRYALPLYPLLSIGAARGLGRAIARLPDARVWLLGALITYSILGLGFEVRGLHTMTTRKNAYAAWADRLAALPEETVITTDAHCLALTLPEIYTGRVVHYADPEDLLAGDWHARAYDAGYREICHVQQPAPTDITLTCRPLIEP